MAPKHYSIYLERDCTSGDESCEFKDGNGVLFFETYLRKYDDFDLSDIHGITLRAAQEKLRSIVDRMLRKNEYNTDIYKLCERLNQWGGDDDSENLLRVDVENVKTKRFQELELIYIACKQVADPKPRVGQFVGIFRTPYDAFRCRSQYPDDNLVVIELEKNSSLDPNKLRLNQKNFISRKSGEDNVVFTPKELAHKKKRFRDRMTNYQPRPIA